MPPVKQNKERPLITDVNPKSPISESYRTLRTNIEFSAIDESIQVIMCTSAGPSEGKSTTGTNLAIVNAQADRKTLIVDCDLRKPTMHHTFGLSNRQGVTTVLSGQADWRNLIQPTRIKNLYLLPAGPIPPNPSEILGSKRMTQLLSELRTEFQSIIVDAPPALAVTDAQIIATKVDGTVLVVDSGKVKRDAIIKVKSNLEHVNGRILGVVINNVERTSDEYYYYYYYGHEDSKNSSN